MLREISHSLSGWSGDDTWIVIVGALAAMACALPGVYLVLRRQSMMGDALSHSVLLGLVTGFVAVHKIFAAEWISRSSYESIRQPAMFVGALVVGVLTAVLTEWVQKLGRVDSTAALGVVFTTLFALGLLLIRIEADSVHIDPDCVLYGTIETVVLDTVGNSDVPRAAIANGAVLAVGLLLMLLFYKELKISAFDPELATTLGINARVLHYTLMAATSITLVAAFESVGSILVIAMLIVPAATASLLTERLSVMILLSLVIATVSSLRGHAAAITLPEVVFGSLGFPVGRCASTAGMMSAAAGVFFVSAVLFAPKQGVLSRAVSQVRLSLKI
ncbi:MAG: metal ABC transporter permease, partial [Planctomycetaceae bacterium]